jgi:hypothetical protein
LLEAALARDLLAGSSGRRDGKQPTLRKPKIWTRIDRRHESLRIGVQDLSGDVGITTATA